MCIPILGQPTPWTYFLFMNKKGTEQGNMVSHQSSWSRCHARARGAIRWDGCGAWRAAPIVLQANVSSAREPDENSDKPGNEPTSSKQKWTEASHLQLPAARTKLCDKTMTAQCLPGESCVGGTKRPMATGEREWCPELKLKAMATCQRRPIVPHHGTLRAN